MSTECENCAHVQVCAIKRAVMEAVERAKNYAGLDRDAKEAVTVTVRCKFFDPCGSSPK